MGKGSKSLLLIVIASIAFVYRFALVTMNIFPPGGDIGLHESVINSITKAPTNFFLNSYHMGGGLSVTNPGYHIFTAFIITMTALPDYLAQALVASFFSALIVLSVFLITRQIWNETAAFFVAILTFFSLGDIYMISWGGYPNIVAISLIPIIFYLLMQPTKRFSKSFLIASSIIISAIFLTHVFTALVLVAIMASTLFVSAFFWKKTSLSKQQTVYWLSGLALGALLVSPYLFQVIPIYFGSEGTITGAVSVTSQAILQTRLIPLEIIGLSLIAALSFFVFSWFRNGKFLSVGAVLFAMWMLVPALATQTYLLGMYLDYDRFLYFLAIPAIVCVGLTIASVPNALSRTAQFLKNRNYLKIGLPSLRISKRIASAILVTIMITCVLFTPLFALPNIAVTEADYFQVMNPSEYQAIQWVKNNTPVGSVCVADAEFGWWLSGFAQRPTLSAVAPQYLLLNHEVAPAQAATNLLFADYLVDNGLLQVKQDGAYANGSSHDILGIFHDSYIHAPVFTVNDTKINVLYRDKGSPQQLNLSALNQTSTNVQTSENQASFLVSRENPLFRITEEITIFRGVSFAQISFTFENRTNNVNFDWLQLPFQSNGVSMQYDNSIAIVDGTLHQLTQIILPYSVLGSDALFQQNPDSYELIQSLYGNSATKVSFFVGISQFSHSISNTQIGELNNIIENNTRGYLHKIGDQALNSFDYQTAIEQWNISYIALRDSAQFQRFSDNPNFSLAFKNDDVAIFKVVR